VGDREEVSSSAVADLDNMVGRWAGTSFGSIRIRW